MSTKSNKNTSPTNIGLFKETPESKKFLGEIKNKSPIKSFPVTSTKIPHEESPSIIKSELQRTTVNAVQIPGGTLIFLTDHKLVVNFPSKKVVGSADDFNEKTKQLINSKPTITIEQEKLAKELNLKISSKITQKYPSLQKSPQKSPQIRIRQSSQKIPSPGLFPFPPQGPRINAILISLQHIPPQISQQITGNNLVFLPDQKLVLNYQVKKVVGSADSIDEDNKKLINFKTTITPEQERLAKEINLKISSKVVQQPSSPQKIPPPQIPPPQIPPPQIPPSQILPSQILPLQIPPLQIPPLQILPLQIPPLQIPPQKQSPSKTSGSKIVNKPRLTSVELNKRHKEIKKELIDRHVTQFSNLNKLDSKLSKEYDKQQILEIFRKMLSLSIERDPIPDNVTIFVITTVKPPLTALFEGNEIYIEYLKIHSLSFLDCVINMYYECYFKIPASFNQAEQNRHRTYPYKKFILQNNELIEPEIENISLKNLYGRALITMGDILLRYTVLEKINCVEIQVLDNYDKDDFHTYNDEAPNGVYIFNFGPEQNFTIRETLDVRCYYDETERIEYERKYDIPSDSETMYAYFDEELQDHREPKCKDIVVYLPAFTKFKLSREFLDKYDIKFGHRSVLHPYNEDFPAPRSVRLLANSESFLRPRLCSSFNGCLITVY